jgi:hypothetical protein
VALTFIAAWFACFAAHSDQSVATTAIMPDSTEASTLVWLAKVVKSVAETSALSSLNDDFNPEYALTRIRE